MSKKIVLLGTLDTKGVELQYIKDIIEAEGLESIVVDVGVMEQSLLKPDVLNTEVASATGENLEKLRIQQDRGKAVDVMMRGADLIVQEIFARGELEGIVSIGGSAGTTIATLAMQNLPVGIPKVMVSTMASGDTRPYVGVKDITMMYSVIDISGINRLSHQILSNAAYAITGMVKGRTKSIFLSDKPLIAATMFGVTTPCVTKAKEYLEQQGYEVLVFHATGSGGKAMEGLIESGFISGVLDVTTTEWSDEIVGGVLSAGPHRLEAASKMGIPQIVSVGALDMVNFGSPDTIPEKFTGRNFYNHSSTITLMRTTVAENKKLGKVIAEKLNMSKGQVAVFLPLQGVSMIDTVDQPFHGEKENQALFETLNATLNKDKIELIEMDNHINDDIFALEMAKKLVEMLKHNK